MKQIARLQKALHFLLKENCSKKKKENLSLFNEARLIIFCLLIINCLLLSKILQAIDLFFLSVCLDSVVAQKPVFV